MKHIFIIAGDTSGDIHAAKLVESLSDYDICFSGIGGKQMEEAGVHVLHDLAQSSVTGVTEILREFSDLKKAFRLGQDFIRNNPIDLLILVDYPGFNLRFAKFAKKQGVKILYYVGPQLWAWRANRIKTIKKTVDTMAVILPFEKAIYDKANVKAYFVGHPLGHIKPDEKKLVSYKEKLHLDKGRSIGLLPGSRKNEVRSFLPLMLKAAEKLKEEHPDLSFVLPVAPNLKQELIDSYLSQSALKVTCVKGEMRDVVNCCYSVIVASGTACLEVTLLQKPMVIIYRTTWFSYILISQFIKTRYLGLCNLLLDRMFIPELLQDDLTSDSLYEVMNRYLTDETLYQKTKQDLKYIGKMLENDTADCTLSTLVLNMLTFSTKKEKETAIRCEKSQVEA